ncbi:hypothetical protein SERLA73DRAFT_78672 [Serpula lacrymans var. lacrymans S7.3]|uniref:Peroxin-3 n=2 Tax=Serpula lacrymans var. lacrymans TaxID=341189 RepID=F8QDZ3_SERL3|nr:uncharacterized protein SERLADRAFT_412016 [Serpula lacrymans var. lacrymans S7.9]EGN93368.1 hypothetical protein SERLA73DRAFT_78672 [Serpula lacrymans var. lacrymans S7.3]EGO18749.1 hypothetical protein SERLADRAFT_412016 [Serpula lacrymans var. lacrymans S7.9]
MFDSVRSYLYARRPMFAKAAGMFGGVYIVAQYIRDRVEEVKYRVVTERVAKETLRRRYDQTREDTSYTITALIPTLAEQILTEMDVEALTNELQSRSRAGREARTLPAAPLNQEYLNAPSPSYFHNNPSTHPKPAPASGSNSSLASYDVDARSDLSASASLASESYEASVRESDGGYGIQSTPNLGHSQTWIDTSVNSTMGSSYSHIDRPLSPEVNHVPEGAPPYTPDPITTSDLEHGTQSPLDRDPESATNLSGSIATSSSAMSHIDRPVSTYDTLSIPANIRVPHTPSHSSPLTSTSSNHLRDSTRSKAELWKDVKILTRSKYVHGIWEAALKEENDWAYSKSLYHLRDDDEGELDVRTMQELGLRIDHDASNISSAGDMSMKANIPLLADIPEDVAESYLSLSYHILHVGWKEVGERVEEAVKAIFNSVSLKTKLGPYELYRLVSDVRKRVEFEIEVDDIGVGREKRVGFLSALLPPASEKQTDQPIVLYGSAPGSSQSVKEGKILAALHAETRTLLSSQEFSIVLEACLDRATDVLFDGLGKNVFVEARVARGDGDGEGYGQEEDLKLRLAGLLPGLARWSQLALNGLPNELVENLMNVKEVAAWEAIVLASYEEWCL